MRVLISGAGMAGRCTHHHHREEPISAPAWTECRRQRQRLEGHPEDGPPRRTSTPQHDLYFESTEKTSSKESGHEKSEEASERYILLHEMAKETDNPVELRSQILHVFLAGHDSTSITIANAIFHLCRSKPAWEKLRAEVISVGDRQLSFETLKDMTYLQRVIKETLRLHPVAPTDTRIAYRDTVLPTGGGPDGSSPILVSEGQRVGTSSHALHRRAENCGSDVEDFRPDRWETCRPGWHYQPFGGGPRMCPGQNLALTETAYVLARMVQEWKECECRDEVEEWVEKLQVTTSSRNGVKVGLVAA